MYGVKKLMLAAIQFNRHGLSKSLNLAVPLNVLESLIENQYRH